MAVLSREEFIARIKARVGEGTSDEDISFTEDMIDTFDAGADNSGWKRKYEENDAEWRRKYHDRFFSADTVQPEGEVTDTYEVPTPEVVEEKESYSFDDAIDWDDEKGDK